MKIKTAFSLLIVLCLLGCSTKVNLEVEKAKVKQVLDQYNQAFEKEDMGLVEKLFAKDADMVFLGTDANEWWVDWPSLKKAIEQQFAVFEQTTITVTDQTIQMHSDGRVAWFAEKMTFTIMSQGQKVALAARFTGVLEKRADQWMFVQGHASIPVSGQAVTY